MPRGGSHPQGALPRVPASPTPDRSWVSSQSLALLQALDQEQDWTQEQPTGPIAACWESGWPSVGPGSSPPCAAPCWLHSTPGSTQGQGLPVPGSTQRSHPAASHSKQHLIFVSIASPAASYSQQHCILISIVSLLGGHSQHHIPSSIAFPAALHPQQLCIPSSFASSLALQPC